MGKIKLLIIMLVCVFFSTACGKDSEKNSIQIDGKTVSLEQIEVNDSIHSMKRVFCVTGKETIEEDFLDSIFQVNAATNEVEWINNQTVSVTEMRFYNEEEEWWRLQCGNGQQMKEYTFQPVEDVGGVSKEFLIDFDEKQISVVLTPYAVSVNCEKDWMQDRQLYQIVAVMEDGSQQEIFILPFNRSKKMEDRELLSLSYLGDGFRIGEEITNADGNATGGKLILRNEIDVDKITDVYIY